MSTPDPTRTPLVLAPTLVARPWGGRRLAPLLGLAAPADAVGEAWLVGPDSVVADGVRLDDLAAAHGAAFVGDVPMRRHGARMPLLVKLLDAAEPLSVQVHPDDAYAARFEAASGHLGKTEAWLVLAAEPGASVAWGFARRVSAAEVRAAAADGSLTRLLHERRVAAGDVVVNEAGVVHAIGAGVLVYEVQQASDLTYRLDDYGRRDAHGRLRDLHLDQALAVAHLDAAGDPARIERLDDGRDLLACTSAFRLERWRPGSVDGATAAGRVEPRSLEVWTLLAGGAELRWDGGRRALHAYQSVVLPASLGAYAWSGQAELVRATA